MRDSKVTFSEEDSYVMVQPNADDDLADVSDYLDTIGDEVDKLSPDVRTISLDIHDHPELQYKEYHAHRILTEYLSQQRGWVVTPSAYGIDTAFVAVFDSGRPGSVVSFNAEYGTHSHRPRSQAG